MCRAAWQTAWSSSARVGRAAGAGAALGSGAGGGALAFGGGALPGRGVGGAFPRGGGVAGDLDSSRRNQPKNDMATSEGTGFSSIIRRTPPPGQAPAFSTSAANASALVSRGPT